MSDGVALVLALALLTATLAAAVADRSWAPESTVAVVGAAVLVGLGALSPSEAGDALEDLAPTAAFLAALLVLAECCRRAGLFDALGGALAAGSRGSPSRLLALVFAAAAGVTAVLSLDATVLLLTPVVLATALRLRTSPRPHAYASAHLANSASLLLPVFQPDEPPRVPRQRPLVRSLRRAHGRAVGGRPRRRVVRPAPLVPRRARPGGPRAADGAAAAAEVRGRRRGAHVRRVLPELARRDRAAVGRRRGGGGARAARAGDAGRGRACRRARRRPGEPREHLPATLLLVPVAAAVGGEAAVLAVLVGVNVGPNLTYAGSLATLLWRRVLHAGDEQVGLSEFTRLGLLTAPAGVVVAVVLLWLGLQVGG